MNKGKGAHLRPVVYEDTDTSRSGGGDRTWQGASAQKAYFRFITQGEFYIGEKRRLVWTIYLAEFSIIYYKVVP